eukprot:735548-Prorocentrum_minimum.AAC.1
MPAMPAGTMKSMLGRPAHPSAVGLHTDVKPLITPCPESCRNFAGENSLQLPRKFRGGPKSAKDS